MSVRRTVARSSAGLLLVAAFAVGPAVAFGEAPAAPGGPSDGGGDSECSQDVNEVYETSLSVSPSEVDPGRSVSLTVQCFPGPGHGPATVEVTGPGGYNAELESVAAAPGGMHTWTFEVPEDADPGDYLFVVNVENFNNNVPFTVLRAEPTDPPTSPEPEPEPEPDESPAPQPSDPSPGEDDGDTGDDSGADESPGPDAGDGEQGDSSGDDGGNDQSTDNADESGGAAGDGDDAGQNSDQADDRNSGDDSPQEDSSEDGDPNASAGGEDSAGQKPAPQQPPAAPGSATNDFPAATPEATADQKQSAALAVLMTNLFAGGVSSGEVGTTPDEARTAIDPSADASEIEVPAGASDAGGTSEASTGSGASDSDALAATGSNMLVPAGIAGLALLAGAGLKISQMRRNR